MKKKISILGSTGSIGLSTFSIIDKKRKDFTINLLSANKNYHLILNQIKKYNPKTFVITNKKIFKKIKKKFKKSNTKILNNFDIKKIKKSDITVTAIPGIAGLYPTLLKTELSKKVLIANKESVICGWDLIKASAKKNKTKLIPVDSEHFSILNLLRNVNKSEIKKIYLTASGGPFLNYKSHQFKKINPKDALNHPKWNMGKKISIDSATLMNKMFELIEAQRLFNIEYDKLDIIIHPDSLVHAIVEFYNGLTKFIYHETSMVIPLANAMFNEKINIETLYKLKKKKKCAVENLTFQNINKKIFPVFKLKNRLNEHPSTGIIINAANEILVDQFLQKKIPFLSISKSIQTILNDRNYKKYAIRRPKNIKQILEINNWAKEVIMKKLCK